MTTNIAKKARIEGGSRPSSPITVEDDEKLVKELTGSLRQYGASTDLMKNVNSSSKLVLDKAKTVVNSTNLSAINNKFNPSLTSLDDTQKFWINSIRANIKSGNPMATFSKVDADNNKALSFEEFTGLLFGYNPVLEPQARELFNLIDMDGDGSIDFGEFLLIIDDPDKMKKDIYSKIENMYEADGILVDYSNVTEIVTMYFNKNINSNAEIQKGYSKLKEVIGKSLFRTNSKYIDELDSMSRFNYAELDEFIQYSKVAIIYANFLKRVMNPDKPVEDFLNAYFNNKKSEMEKSISSSTKLK